jgi:hypothetical protein
MGSLRKPRKLLTPASMPAGFRLGWAATEAARVEPPFKTLIKAVDAANKGQIKTIFLFT